MAMPASPWASGCNFMQILRFYLEIRTQMRNFAAKSEEMKKLFIALLALTVLTGCHKDKEEDRSADRTVLVYMSGENNLSSFAQKDLDELIIGSKSIGHNNLIVYVDRSSYKELPWLARLKDGQITDSVSIADMGISESDEYASDPAVMEKVIRYTINKYPSNNNDYALAFFGHGSGWLVKDSIAYTSMARNRAYGIDNGRNSESMDGKWLNIPSMKKVLEKFPRFSYIFFDCCNMQCLEVAYELRNVADYIIGSPAEIPAVGAPYITVAPAMMEKTTFWKSIVDRYAEQRASGYDLPLSVIKTSEMENLAHATKNALNASKENFSGSTYPNLSGLIHYYYTFSDKQLYYDANDFILKYAPTNEYNTWKQAFDKVVIYKIMADTWMTNLVPSWGIWNDFYGDFEMTEEKYGGVSMFIPQWKSQTTDNINIKQFGWYYAAGYESVGW